jgi:HAD superfamily hydrolase (TIGR01459 family)
MTAKIIHSIDEISGGYDALLCDIWGVYHNGLRPYDAAVDALRRFRDKGGVVLLLTNAPRPWTAVRAQLDGMGAPEDSYDAIVSSGDAAKAAVASGVWGRKLFHIGAPKDEPFFEGADIDRVPLDQAEAIVCTGLFDDDVETPQDYADTIAAGVARGLKLLCANPDIVVDKGDRRIFCAGAIAEAYRDAGGEPVYFGKPHLPIYDLARQVLEEKAGRSIDARRILAVGDGVKTDVAGAGAAKLDCLFIIGGLAAAEIGRRDGGPDPDRLRAFLQGNQVFPRYAMDNLK